MPSIPGPYRPGMTPVLRAPTSLVADSFRAALDEYRAEGRLGPDDDSELADALRRCGPLDTEGGFAAFLESLRIRATLDTPFPVPSTMLWLVDGPAFLGRISIRHRLTPALRRLGGHIGYEVRPSARRRGHATAMLRAALPVAAGLGISSALLTCDVGNIASRRVIAAAGGVLHEEEGTIARYLVATR